MPEGKSNKQLRDWVKLQEVKYNSVKKRHLKDLSVEEIDEIVSAAQIPYMLHKDIAQVFRVSRLLVGKLVKMSEDEPEKFEGIE